VTGVLTTEGLVRGIEWDEGCRVLLREAREISREPGHHEIVCPLHLLLALLVNVRPSSLAVAAPSWPSVLEAMGGFTPPWGDVVVLSPGGQTPTTKRVLSRAIELARAGGLVQVEHVWSALRELEPELVGAVMCRLGLTDKEGAGTC
jgi:hypothetical protein